MLCAANDGSEPNLQDAAACINVGYAFLWVADNLLLAYEV